MLAMLAMLIFSAVHGVPLSGPDYLQHMRGVPNFLAEMKSKCNFVLRDFADFPDVAVHHAPSNHAYDLYQSVHLLDEPHPDLIPSSDGFPKFGSCEYEQTVEGIAGTWKLYRVGPFRSTGSPDGGDWWGIQTSKAISFPKTAAGHASFFMAHHSALVLPDGDPIGLPPFYMHHSHLEPGPGGAGMNLYDCVFRGHACMDMGMMFQHHGDIVDHSRDGGMESVMTKWYDGRMRAVTEDISLFTEWNDVRPLRSPPVEHWYQFGVLTTTDDVGINSKALSFHVFGNPIDMTSTLRRAQGQGLLFLPPDVDSMTYHTGRMPYAGTAFDIFGHVHAETVQASYLFVDATPENVGLVGAYALHSSVGHLRTATLVSAAAPEPADGANNRRFHSEVVLPSLAKTQASHKAGPKQFLPMPRQLCNLTPVLEVVDGKKYPRAPAVDCKPWTFNTAAQVTVVSYFGSSGYVNFTTELPGYPHHVYYYISYDSPIPGSHFTVQMGSVDADAIDPVYSLRDSLRLLSGLETPSFPDGPGRQFIMYPLAYLLIAELRVFHMFRAPNVNIWSIDGKTPDVMFGMIGEFLVTSVLLIVAGLVAFLCFWFKTVGKRPPDERHSCCFAVTAFVLFYVTVQANLAFVLRTFVFPIRAYGGNQYDNELLQDMYFPTNKLLWDIVGVIGMTVLMVLTCSCCSKTLCSTALKSPAQQDTLLM